MPNVSGQAFAFTCLSPIIMGSTEGVIHAAEIRSVLARLNHLTPGPFAHVPTTHFARWVVLDDLIQMGEPAADDHLQSKYLLFAADFDGPLGPWLDLLATNIRGVIDQVYAHCVGYPGAADLHAFRRYMTECQIDTTFFFAPYGDRKVSEVLQALQLQRQLIAFVRANQGRPAAELQRAFRAFDAAVRSAPPPSPGVP
jgi:hypothetical protein